MTDTDHLSTPIDMVTVLLRLAKIMRDVEALPDNAQQRFWEDTLHSLNGLPIEDLRLDAGVSKRSVSALYNLLVGMCGPQLVEMVNGDVKAYYEGLLTQMKTMMDCEWDVFLDQHKGAAVSVALRSTNNIIGKGTLKRVADSKILKLTDDDGEERYFSSKDIVMLKLESR